MINPQALTKSTKPAFDVQKFIAEHTDGTTIQLPTEEEEAQQELEKEQRRLELRRANCGRHGVKVSAKNGKWKRVKYRCGLWRDGFCPKCYAERMANVKDRYIRARARCKEPKAVLVEKGDAVKLTRKLRDSDIKYERYPTEMGDFVIYDAALYQNDNFKQIPLDDLDFDAIVSTPEGRRFSGSLGADLAVSTTDSDGDTISVKTTVIIAKPAEGHKLSEAWQEALEATKSLNPGFDVNEIQDACNKRINAYRTAILKQGGQVLFTSKAIEIVSSNSLSWKDDSELDDKHLWVMDLPNNAETPDWADK